MAWQTALPNTNPHMTTAVNPAFSFGGSTGGGTAVPTTGQIWPRGA